MRPSNNPTDIRDDWDEHWSHLDSAASANPAQRMRHDIIRRLLQEEPPTAIRRICDFGSGQGDLAIVLTSALPAAEFAGLEMSRYGVEVSRRKVPTGAFHIANLFENHPDEFGLRNWATHGTCSEVLEHVDDPKAFLERCRDYLAPNARLIITVPGGPMSAFDRHIGHRTHFSQQSISALLDAAGYRVERTCLAGFPFFNLYRLTVILRGRRLAQDVSQQNSGLATRMARMTMAVFRLLFRANFLDTPFGWQVVAIARKQR